MVTVTARSFICDARTAHILAGTTVRYMRWSCTCGQSRAYRNTPCSLKSVSATSETSNSNALPKSGTRKLWRTAHDRTHKVTAVTVGALPWRLLRPKLSDNSWIYRLGHQGTYAHHLHWQGEQPGRPSWPKKCTRVGRTGKPRGATARTRSGAPRRLR